MVAIHHMFPIPHQFGLLPLEYGLNEEAEHAALVQSLEHGLNDEAYYGKLVQPLEHGLNDEAENAVLVQLLEHSLTDDAEYAACERLVQYLSMCIADSMSEEEKLSHCQSFTDGEKRIIVTTTNMPGIKRKRINIVINYDTPLCAKSYHKLVDSTKLVITFVSSSADFEVISDIEEISDLLPQLMPKFT
ncbi:DEAD-box ATP-dependent RNA helicase 56-like [Eutrema salsugineum]|uniref:DEAD-box ATP-dependent RNA helicase 56-like n=1 Tax=Eutrema salsugineum TaxID=72664 RepID=UPI000CED247C|nr:DEAD-box ATP-dependent RNA helicase 56-like [Eutrema salsugineum]